MEQPPPLTPEEITELSSKEYAQLGQPQVVKVFGILHVIFAAFGILSGVWALFVTLFGNPIMKMMAKNPDMKAQVEAQAVIEEQMFSIALVSTFIGLFIACLMMTAGIKLLQKRKNGLKWSNRYAWTSLAGKAFNLVIGLAFTLPMMKEMNTGTAGVGAMEGVLIGSIIGGVLVTCIYPILTLVLLNRPNTKNWFANQPG